MTSKPYKVLVADDNKHSRMALQRAIDFFPEFEVIPVTDGKEALNEIAARMPSIVVTDVDMPGVTGLDILHELRTNPITIGIPVIFLSGKEHAERRRGPANGSPDACFAKPCAMRELIQTIRKLVGATRPLQCGVRS